ncbi:MAG: cytochrome c biogenesis protein CcdA [Gammaproteobacteria bacterium]|jgi:cytochrome c-type biogenesis protein
MDAFAQWLTPFLTGGSLLALPLVVLGGLITAFNPCCLPMYPAAFGFIGGACCSNEDAASTGCGQPAVKPLTGITLLFVLGMATATSIMGILTAGLGWVFGRFDTTFLMLLAVVPLLMGLNLLGLLPLRLPVWHSTRLHAIADERLKHKITAFSAGLVFSLAIAPCATPILLGILTLVAMENDLVYGGVLMFVYGIGAGLPLLLIGHGLNRIQNLLNAPKRQKWLQRVSGLLLISVSLYIVWNV